MQANLKKNFILSLTAQLVSFCASLVVQFLIPAFITEDQQSHWYTVSVYLTCFGLFHFGLLDGIILRYSQYDYDEIDKTRMRSIFKFLLVTTGAMCVLTCVTSAFFLKAESLWIIILVAVGVVTKNAFTYSSYTFQITNRISCYSLLVIIQRALYALFVVLLFVLRVNDFYWYCIAELLGDVLGILLTSFFNKGMYFGKTLSLKETCKEAWANISSGALLMFATLSASFIVLGAKMVTHWAWGYDDVLYTQVQFAFTVANTFLTFITAISIVLFPSLKRMKQEEVDGLYHKIRTMLSPVLFGALLLYFPASELLKVLIPSKAGSMLYLGMLLPLIVFSSKTNLLAKNYLKVYRKEKWMLISNCIFVAFGFALFLLSAFVLHNIELLLYSVVLTLMVSSVVSEVMVMKLIKKMKIIDFFIELVMTVGFIVIVRLCSVWIGFAVYALAVLVYVIIYRKSVADLLKSVGISFGKKKNINVEKEQ